MKRRTKMTRGQPRRHPRLAPISEHQEQPMPRSDRISVEPGVELHYLTSGTGRPLVFIHGIWASARFFAPQLTALGRNYRTIALDLRGHGQSAMTLKDQSVA